MSHAGVTRGLKEKCQMALMRHLADCATHQRRGISSIPQLTCDALKECHSYRSSGPEACNCHIVELNGADNAEVCGRRLYMSRQRPRSALRIGVNDDYIMQASTPGPEQESWQRLPLLSFGKESPACTCALVRFWHAKLSATRVLAPTFRDSKERASFF